MGWTSMYTGFGSGNSRRIKEFIMDEWTSPKIQPIDFSRKGNTIYQAIKVIETGEVFAVVTMISFHKGEFYWKDIDETMGPVQEDCPQRILKLLSPTDSDFANDWRKRCWEYHKRQKSLKYEHGDLLEFPREITFTDGYETNQMILIKEGRKMLFAPYNGQEKAPSYGLYRITNWRKQEPVVVKNLA